MWKMLGDGDQWENREFCAHGDRDKPSSSTSPHQSVGPGWPSNRVVIAALFLSKMLQHEWLRLVMLSKDSTMVSRVGEGVRACACDYSTSPTTHDSGRIVCENQAAKFLSSKGVQIIIVPRLHKHGCLLIKLEPFLDFFFKAFSFSTKQKQDSRPQERNNFQISMGGSPERLT